MDHPLYGYELPAFVTSLLSRLALPFPIAGWVVDHQRGLRLTAKVGDRMFAYPRRDPTTGLDYMKIEDRTERGISDQLAIMTRGLLNEVASA